jgi:DnaJ-class molecular chaperone
MAFKNYYTILGLKDYSTVSEIRKAYRALAFRYHPDHNKAGKSGAEKFIEIKEAYEVLLDPVKKGQFDHHLRNNNMYAPSYSFSRYVQNQESGSTTTDAPKKKEPIWLVILKPVILIIITIALMYLIMQPPPWLTGFLGKR